MAQDEKTIIRSLSDPNIQIDLLQIDDIFTGTSPDSVNGESSGRQYQNHIGTQFPFITINGYVFDSGEIVMMKIDATGFLPQIIFIFELYKSDVFRSQGYPKDGDIISVFIRAKNDSFKPIRNDYIIKNVDSGRGGIENSGGETVIHGELFIPHIKDEIIKSYKDTSFNVLKAIADDLDLGFSTNETATNDLQTWINGGSTWEDFIKDVCASSWSDEKSFYKCFIDIYYNLNFINVNNQLDSDGQPAAGILDVIGIHDVLINDGGSVERSQQSIGKFISNMSNFQGTNMFIPHYQTRNESTRIHELFGYKYNVQFFDQVSSKYWNIFVDPIVSTGAENTKIILKGRTFPKNDDQKNNNGTAPSQQDYWKDQQKYVWKGVQSKNVHDKYLYAISHNERNLQELKKLYIEADIQRWNPNIYNGEKLPIIIASQADKMKASADAIGVDRDTVNSQEGQAGNPAVLDPFYSGYYMVNGISITYHRDSSHFSPTAPDDKAGSYEPAFFETVILTRREWPTPAG